MAIQKNITCIIFTAAMFMAFALPIPHLNDTDFPWAHPCMPNRQPIEVEDNHSSTDLNIINLIEKADNLQTLEGKLADLQVTSSLQRIHVDGFPEVKRSGTKNGVSMYLDQFSQLSKAAVFFEQMKYDGDDRNEDLRSGLSDLFTENLRQMCEVHLVLASLNTQLPTPVSRSIMSPELRNLTNCYELHRRNFLILYQYNTLLESHLAQYEEIRTKSSTPSSI